MATFSQALQAATATFPQFTRAQITEVACAAKGARPRAAVLTYLRTQGLAETEARRSVLELFPALEKLAR